MCRRQASGFGFRVSGIGLLALGSGFSAVLASRLSPFNRPKAHVTTNPWAYHLLVPKYFRTPIVL